MPNLHKFRWMMSEVKTEQEGSCITRGLAHHYCRWTTLWPWTILIIFLSFIHFCLIRWLVPSSSLTDRSQYLVIFTPFYITHDFLGLSRMAVGDHRVQFEGLRKKRLDVVPPATGCYLDNWMLSAGCFLISWN